MDINTKEFMLRESIRRVANGGYTEVNYDRHAIRFTWTPGHNPLEVAGREASSTRVNEAVLNTLDGLNEPIKLLHGQDQRGNFMVFCVVSRPIDFKSQYVTTVATFSTLLELLQYVRKYMSPTGTIGQPDPNKEQEQTVYVNNWGLYKESYSNAEVVEILNNFKAELIESIGQLSNRLVNRIQK